MKVTESSLVHTWHVWGGVAHPLATLINSRREMCKFKYVAEYLELIDVRRQNNSYPAPNSWRQVGNSVLAESGRSELRYAEIHLRIV